LSAAFAASTSSTKGLPSSTFTEFRSSLNITSG
jgi:hypothetical protein